MSLAEQAGQRHSPVKVVHSVAELAADLTAQRLGRVSVEGDLDVDGLDGVGAACNSEHVGERFELAMNQACVALSRGVDGRGVVGIGFGGAVVGQEPLGRAAQREGRHAVGGLLVAVAVGDPVVAVPGAEVDLRDALVGVEL